ncbi:phosphate ABC transporter permease subunit PstC [Oleiharenicola lentus]|uniref:phosphate ABC transporter permease subunit PstC n=1 Tax=Oleiharenicola lentus TaxID=2508720 RepID=UPI003F67A9D5
MSAPVTQTPTTRPSTSVALLRKRRGWFFGLTGDQFVKYVFQGNAVISIIALILITFTIFKDAVGFIPQNHSNLAVYRLAGLEFVDILREQVKSHTAMSRYLASLRMQRLDTLLKKENLTPADATARLAAFDEFANKFADTTSDHETILGNMTELASSIKERQKVAEDLTEAKQNFLNEMVRVSAERATELKKQADAIEIETLNFKAEVLPLRAMRAEVLAANEKQVAALRELVVNPPKFNDAALDGRMDKFKGFVERYLGEVKTTEEKLAAWDQSKPVTWLESFNAFAFGRQWVTASFWQDWYGIIPLLTGSLMIAFIALIIAIPLGVAAAVYTSQVARPAEQQFIKPYIEFISAIPSVVLGFFGIAMLGETLRRVSQIPSLNWIPGFPMAERLNATTAACLLALLAIPTIFSLAEDAINNVPRAFKEASLALGATRLQTIIHITVPAALSGIMAAILLGFGRVIGETMVVLLCAGNRIQIPEFSSGLGVIFQPVHTMTGIIAQEMGEVVRNSIHYRALFMVGVVLFMISLTVNWLAQKIVRRYRISIG